jgi:hypothetical protein
MTTMALVIATALHAFPGAPAGSQDQACRGELQGNELRTTIQFEDGSSLIGPWRIAHVSGADEHRVTGVLDRVIEVDRRGVTQTTPFPHGVAVLFEGRSERDMIEHAAEVWCSTVRRARSARGVEWSMQQPVRVTTGPLSAAGRPLA